MVFVVRVSSLHNIEACELELDSDPCWAAGSRLHTTNRFYPHSRVWRFAQIFGWKYLDKKWSRPESWPDGGSFHFARVQSIHEVNSSVSPFLGRQFCQFFATIFSTKFALTFFKADIFTAIALLDRCSYVTLSVGHSRSLHCTMCTFCNICSFGLNKLGHILKFVICYTIQHIFFPFCSVRRNMEKYQFSWVSHSKFVTICRQFSLNYSLVSYTRFGA